MLPGDCDIAVVEDIWECLRGGLGFTAVLQRIITNSGSRLKDLGEFAVVLADKGAVRTAVRGSLVVQATTSKGSVNLDGRGVASWREESITEVTALRVGQVVDGKAGPRADAQFLPIVAGVVSASEVTLEVAVLVDPVFPAVRRVPEEARPREGALEVGISSVPKAASFRHRLSTSTAFVEGVPSSGPKSDTNLAGEPEVVDEPKVANSEADVPTKVENHASSSTTILPHTDHGLVDNEEESLHSTTFFSNLWADAPGAASPAQPASAAAIVQPQVLGDDDHDGMTVLGMDSLGQPSALDDHDGMTVLGFASKDETPLPYPPPLPNGPVVLARLCPTCGSAYSTRTVTCKKCGAALVGDAVQIPRPSLGLIQLPDGETAPIEHPLIVGRRPEAGRFSYSDLPVVVKVDDQHISSTHLRIDLEDWSVLVTNLGRNGTVLRRLGQADRGLSDSEQVIAQVGDQFILGPGINVTIVELT
jgi:hypothetical protein